MKKILMIALIAVAAISCNKDQKAVKKLDGEWKAVKFIDADEPTVNLAALFDIRAIFTECELKDDDYCTVTTKVTFDGNTETESSQFKVSGDGTIMEFKSADGSIETFEITELSKDELKMSGDGDIYEFEKI